MAKSRKGRAALKTGPLAGGVSADPAGRGGFADQLFQAREASRPGGVATEYDSMPELPPAPENRYIENFQTVGDDLRSSMGVNRDDNAKLPALRQMADSMTGVIDELARETDPDMKSRMVQALKAYQEAFQAQTPDQRQFLISMVAPERQAEVAKVFGRDAIVDYEQGGQINLPFMDRTPSNAIPGLRAARATEMDFLGDEDRYNALPREPDDFYRPYGNTDRGQAQYRLLGSLLDEGVDPNDISEAMLGDTAVDPFTPGPGMILNRDDAPDASRLSTYIGNTQAGSRAFRPEEKLNPTSIGRELLSQNDAIERRGGSPFFQNLIGDEVPSDDVIDQPRFGEMTGIEAADQFAKVQMKPELQTNQESLYQLAFGRSISSDNLDGTPRVLTEEDISRGAGEFDLDHFAPWASSKIQQTAPDGSVVMGDWTPEQVLSTVFNQNLFLAESPHLRDAAFQRMLPQVVSALEKRRMGGFEAQGQYERNATGKRLLQEEGADLTRPTPQRPMPTGPSPESIREQLERSLKKRNSQTKDMGFSDPYNVPKYMAGAMPNRLLSSLIG